jgi:glutathione synthase/RimK-type ligase-like ATP-grasp enzyme
MILIIGHATDPTTVHSVRSARRSGHDVAFVELRSFLERGEFFWDSRAKNGYLELDDARYEFPSESITGIYCRLIDLSDRFTGKVRRRMRARVIGLSKILNETDTFVVNRPGIDISNAAKVFHTELLRRIGFSIPEYILTNDAADARDFLERYPDAIYKGASSAKTIATKVREEDFQRLHQLSHTPVLFQRRIVGDEMRVHVVGNEAFAERIITDAVDYRFDDAEKKMIAAVLPPELLERAQHYRRQSGLSLIGIDFRVTPEGEFFVLEANPMPGYDGYDRRAGHAISDALFRLLARGGARGAEPLEERLAAG